MKKRTSNSCFIRSNPDCNQHQLKSVTTLNFFFISGFIDSGSIIVRSPSLLAKKGQYSINIDHRPMTLRSCNQNHYSKILRIQGLLIIEELSRFSSLRKFLSLLASVHFTISSNIDYKSSKQVFDALIKLPKLCCYLSKLVDFLLSIAAC